MTKFSEFNNSVLLHSYAKINLSLDVLGKVSIPGKNVYHKLCMIMQTVSLHDDVRVIRTLNPGNIKISCSNSRFVPANEKNIAYKAAKLIFEKYPLETSGFGLEIRIKKRIPVSAGLAGGSGNAAAVIKAMNQLFDLSMSNEEMCSEGLKIGADVPYCIHGGTMLAEGIGEILTPLNPLPKSVFLLINPGKPLSTAAIFSSIKEVSSLPHPDTDLLLRYLKRRNLSGFMKNTANSLETPASLLMPSILDIKETLMKKGAQGALMSGSGPTVFALFKDVDSAKKASLYFSNTNKKFKTYVTTSC